MKTASAISPFGRGAPARTLVFASLLSVLSLPLAPRASADKTFGSVVAPGADIESVRSYLLDHNPELRALRAEAEAADARVFPAGALPDPMLRIDLGDIPVGSGAVLPGNAGYTTYEVRQTFPLWGKRGLARDIASAESKSMHLMRRAETLELLSSAESAYVRYWHAHASVAVIDRLIVLLEQIEEIAGVRYALGMTAQQDAIRAQVERTAMQRQKIEFVARGREYSTELNALLGRPADAGLSAPDATPSLPVAQPDLALAIARLQQNRHPAIASRLALIDASAANKRLQLRNRLPDVTLGITPMQRGSGLESYELMFEVDIPLQQRARRERERESRLLEEAAIARAESVRTGLQGRVGSAMSRWKGAREQRLLIERTLLVQADANYRSALESYRVGEVDFGTLLDALREWQGADLARLDALRDELLGAAELRGIEGEAP